MTIANHPSSVSRASFDDVMMPNYVPGSFIPVRGLGSQIWDQAGREYVESGAFTAHHC